MTKSDPTLAVILKHFGDLKGQRIYDGKPPAAREALVKRLKVAGKV